MEDTYKGQVDNPLSLNRYTYVHNNPLRFIDPTGHVAAEGAGGYFGGSYEDLMLHWSDVAVAYADANGLDFIDAVDIVVPVEHRAEVKTIVSSNGAVKTHYQAGDMPGLGLGAAGAGAVAATIKNTGKMGFKGAENLSELIKKVSAGRGSTGRTISNSLEEQIAMKEVLSNPLEGATAVPTKNMNDARWLGSEGWVKMQKIVPYGPLDKNGNITKKVNIHFNYNTKTREFDDFKFK